MILTPVTAAYVMFILVKGSLTTKMNLKHDIKTLCYTL